MSSIEIARMFDEALQHASPGWALGRRLSELHPELALVEGTSHLFDVQTFAAGGKCTFELWDSIYHQLESGWYPDHGLRSRAQIAWLKVTWEATALDVVLLSWPGPFGHDTNRYYLLGPSRERCNAFLEAVSRWNHDVRGEVLVFSEGCFSKSTKLYAAIEAASFDQLVLDGTFKQQIRDDFTQFVRSRETYEEHGVPWKRGALFIGPPGNGKTLCVKALIRELALPCLYIQSFQAQHSTVQHSVEEVFRRARSTAPCILVLEDIDALLVEGTRSFFLNELDGFASNTGVITLATTNHPERLDPSIVERPSRFDRKYHFELPSSSARAEYIAGWNDRLRPALRLSNDGLARVVEATAEFSFAYIQEVFVSSMMRWMSTRDSTGILPVALDQVELLRAQMLSRAATPTPAA